MFALAGIRGCFAVSPRVLSLDPAHGAPMRLSASPQGWGAAPLARKSGNGSDKTKAPASASGALSGESLCQEFAAVRDCAHAGWIQVCSHVAHYEDRSGRRLRATLLKREISFCALRDPLAYIIFGGKSEWHENNRMRAESNSGEEPRKLLL